jgi:hypothetical protein
VRSVRRSLLVCCAVVAVFGAPAGGAQARPTGVDHLVWITQAFQRGHAAVLPAGRQAGADRRAAANLCRDDVADATPEAALELETHLFLWTQAGWDERLGPPRWAWITALRADRAVMAIPVLARAVRAWRSVDQQVRAAERAVTDFCADVRSWAAAGWRPDATPAAVTDVHDRVARALPAGDRLDAATQAATRYLRRQSVGRSVRATVADGGDVGDAATLPGDDPLVVALRERQRSS